MTGGYRPSGLPLTWAQESWRRGYGTDPWHQMVHTVRTVPFRPSPEQLHRALLRVVDSQPVLRSRVVADGDGPVRQHVLEPASPLLAAALREHAATALRPGGGSPEEQLRRHTAGFAELPAEQVPGLAVIDLPAPPGTARLGLAAPHALVDGWGVDVAARALVQALAGEAPPDGRSALDEVVEFQLGDRGAEAGRDAVGYLVSGAREAAALGLGRPAPAAPGGVRMSSWRTSSPWFWRFLARTTPRSRLSRAAVMCALGQLAFARMSGGLGAHVATTVANRTTEQERAFVGIAFQTSWFTEQPAPATGFDALVRRTAGHLLRCAQHGRHDPARLSEALAAEAGLPRPGLYFNYLESPRANWDGGPSGDGAAPSDPVAPSSGADWVDGERGPWPIEFNAWVDGTDVKIIVIRDGSVVPRAEADAFIDALFSLAHRVDADPRIGVGELVGG